MAKYYGVDCPNGDKIAIGVLSDEGLNKMTITAIPELEEPIICPKCGDSREYAPENIVGVDDPDCYLPGCPAP